MKNDGVVYVHKHCGNAVDKRFSNKPIVTAPPSKEVKAEQTQHAKMTADFAKVAR